MLKGIWHPIEQLPARNYTCGHTGCGREVGSEKGWFHQTTKNERDAYIYICPVCQSPTFFPDTSQIPGVSIGDAIGHLPEEIAHLYGEIRMATSQEAFTAAVLACRKLLMHIAVEKGAPENSSFVDYVNYLADNHYAPPNSAAWVDKIRQKGNEANHEITIIGKEDALEIITFLEMLLKFIYEFPAKATS